MMDGDGQENWCAVNIDYSQATFPTPREWQPKAQSMLRENFRAGHRRQILTSATGSGKTMAALQLLHGSLIKGKRAIFVCDRTVLINQTSARADQYGLPHGIIQADHWRRDTTIPFQICSIQTIAKRDYWPQADLIVIDEAHVIHAATREKILSTNAAVIGLTATPCTKGLGLIYSALVNATSMHELTEQGVLVPLRMLACVKPDMSGAETSGGEWTARAASEREATIIGDVVGEWLTHGEGRKTIAFGADIAYCTELCMRFNAAGIKAMRYTSQTPDDERTEIVREFETPESSIRILCSVAALSRGFDVPDVGCIIDARPLRKSLSEVIQMWGRGLRCAPGKSDCILLDHAGNIGRFLPDFERVYFDGFKTLDDGEKADKQIRQDPKSEGNGCPKCGHKPFHHHCVACGYEKQTKAEVDESAGVMKEIRLGGKKAASDKLDLWRQLAGYVRRSSSNKKDGYARHLFRNITGEWPPRDWLVDFTDAVAPSKATLGEIKRQQFAYRAAREKA
jgi:DNA repair protein RadD